MLLLIHMQDEIKKFLGIDYGLKRVGLSLSDDLGQMAFPADVLENNQLLIENIKKVVKENKVNKVVLGESKNFLMQDNEIMKDILDLKSVLETELEMDIVLHNEIFSTQMAERGQGKIKKIDASAATIILQSYIDSLKNKTN